MAYNLHSCTRKDYKTLAEPKIPRATRQKKADCSQALYPIEVRERQENSVKIHYIGYSDEHDEWRDPSELVNIGSDGHQLETYLSSLQSPSGASVSNQARSTFWKQKRPRSQNRAPIRSAAV